MTVDLKLSELFVYGLYLYVNCKHNNSVTI